jgi:hypothetical protein
MASVSNLRVEMANDSMRPAFDALDQLASLPVPGVAADALRLRRRMGAESERATFFELGVRYEMGDWQWSAEYMRIANEPFVKQDTVYATVGHRVGDWTPYVSYSHMREGTQALTTPAWQDALTPVLGPALAAQSQMMGAMLVASVNATRIVQSTLSVGARWDLHPQAALKLQFDSTRNKAGGAGLWTGSDVRAARSRVASAVVDFIF